MWTELGGSDQNKVPLDRMMDKLKELKVCDPGQPGATVRVALLPRIYRMNRDTTHRHYGSTVAQSVWKSPAFFQ